MIKKNKFVIGAAGGSCSGKTTITQEILHKYGSDKVTVFKIDWYYKGKPKDKEVEELNFDHPKAIDWDYAISSLIDLINGKSIDRPIYDFLTHSRSQKTKKINPTEIIIVEGIFALYHPKLRYLYDFTFYVDADSDVRYRRRMKRDVEIGRTVKEIDEAWENVKMGHNNFILPTRQFAHIVINNNKNDALKQIVQQKQLDIIIVYVGNKIEMNKI